MTATIQRPRPYSTKLFRPPAPEFEQIFVQHGWAKVNRMFGKRCSVRWYAMLGAERLKAARASYVRGIVTNVGPDAV